MHCEIYLSNVYFEVEISAMLYKVEVGDGRLTL